MINYESVSTRPCFRLSPAPTLLFRIIRPISWHFCDGINSRIVVDGDASIHTAKNISHSAPRAKLGIGHYRYALVNILIESDFVVIN